MQSIGDLVLKRCAPRPTRSPKQHSTPALRPRCDDIARATANVVPPKVTDGLAFGRNVMANGRTGNPASGFSVEQKISYGRSLFPGQHSGANPAEPRIETVAPQDLRSKSHVRTERYDRRDYFLVADGKFTYRERNIDLRQHGRQPVGWRGLEPRGNRAAKKSGVRIPGEGPGVGSKPLLVDQYIVVGPYNMSPPGRGECRVSRIAQAGFRLVETPERQTAREGVQNFGGSVSACVV